MNSNLLTFKPVVICLFLSASCGQSGQNNRQADGVISQAFLQEVVTTKAVLQPFQKELSLTGKVTADPNKIITYSPLVSGVIVKSYFTLGDRVRRGETMVDIRSSELSGLQS
ncbi:MAG: efflux RND transporter periplasmic adaptor subunit [Prevotellaceae bacterium]|jgi:cobalt-zinc-cadmium efflux system membrane fusion protein|nr:efflux RND transporter periplasmic adaptor subunit [Prevotellaceae bacterium]